MFITGLYLTYLDDLFCLMCSFITGYDIIIMLVGNCTCLFKRLLLNESKSFNAGTVCNALQLISKKVIRNCV